MMGRAMRSGALALALFLGGCEAERRELAASQPSSAPNAPDDPRGALVETNAYQVSQGGRLFGAYGCSDCHGLGAAPPLDLADGRWLHGARPGEVYRSIAAGPAHAYAGKVVDEQLWQLTAYVRKLNETPPAKRRRQDADTGAEPKADRWSGALP
jgi:cytochrome c oxidase cbb3-type subunit 3